MLTPPLPNNTSPDQYPLLAGLLVGRVPIGRVGGEAEWEALLSLALAQGVGPLLARCLDGCGDEEVPASVRRSLEALYLTANYESLIQQSTRERLCRRLRDRGIPTLLLKGAALAYTCYEDPATRPMADLDLLIPATAKLQAALCLEEEGFQPVSGSRAAELESARAHLSYVHRARQTKVEIHWELRLFGPARAKATAEIWAGAQPSTESKSAQVMRLGHTLPLLCAHMLLQHRRPLLLWLYDLHRVLLRMDAAEAALARQAAVRWGLAPCTALALLQTQQLFGTRLPAELAAWAHGAASRRGLQAKVAAHALARSQELPHRLIFDVVMNRHHSRWWVLIPPPRDAPHLLGLGANTRTGPGVYARLLWKRLRGAPRHLRRLWQFWWTDPRPAWSPAPHPPLPAGDSEEESVRTPP